MHSKQSSSLFDIEPNVSVLLPSETPLIPPEIIDSTGAIDPGPPAGSILIKLETTGTTSHFRQKDLIPDDEIFSETIAAKLDAIGELATARTIRQCHTELIYQVCQGCWKVRRFLNHCDNAWCPKCVAGLARQRVESIRWWSARVNQPKHVVLTVRNTKKITQRQISEFKAALARLRRMKIARGWKGGCWTLEVTNEGRGWHLHAHLLVDCRYIPAGELAIAWDKASRGKGHIVKVKDCRAKEYLREVAKYICKSSEIATWAAQDILQFINAIHKQRTFGVFGSMLGHRSAYRAHLVEAHLTARTCQCGSCKFRYFDHDSYVWHTMQQEGLTPIPPPD